MADVVSDVVSDGNGVVVVDDAVSADVVAGIAAGIRSSKLVGESQLTGGFVSTRGFGVVCHVSAAADAVARAPFLGPFVDLALNRRFRDAARPPTLVDRVGGAVFDDINALYVNVLSVPPGAAVERHTDATLGTATGDPRTIVPRAVIVLYVDIPADLAGGELRLYAEKQSAPVASIKPRTRRLVAFDGRLAHEVTSTTSTSSRVSCVAELYRLPRARLQALPRLRVQSNGFADVLQRLR